MSSRQVVIIESSPTDMVAKMAKYLRREGYETFLLTLTGDLSAPLLQEAYTQRFSIGASFFKINVRTLPSILFHGLRKTPALVRFYSLLRTLKPSVVIGRSNPNWLCALALRYYRRKAPFIFFPYDIRSYVYTSRAEAIQSGVPAFELDAERYCLEHADGIIHKGADDELTLFDTKVHTKMPKITCPVLHFLPYCDDDLMAPMKKKNHKDPSLVFIGHIGVEDSWYDSVKAVLDEKIHLHLYGKTANVANRDGEIRRRYGSLLDSPYLHLHPQMDQKALIPEISKYDYGIWLGYPYQTGKNVFTATGNKQASYLEAGIPILFYDNHTYLIKLFCHYPAGVSISIKKPLRKTLARYPYSSLAKGVAQARTELRMSVQIPRLVRFFDEAHQHFTKN